MYSDIAVIIPARIGSTRLPAKPLKIIGDKTMIEHVVAQIRTSGIEEIYVATDSEEIADKLKTSDARIIITSTDCKTGTDRVYEAFQKLKNNDKVNYVINVQGDMPFIDGKLVLDIANGLKSKKHDIMTAVAKVGLDIAQSFSNVKVVIDKNMKALYFSRALIPHNAEEFLYHIGIYGFQKEALERFVKMEMTEYEKIEKLEQLRALENGMNIGVCYSDQIPISVDTEEDLEKAREYWQERKG